MQNNTEPQLSQNNPFACRLMSESFINQFQFRCVCKCLELTKPQASVRNLLNLEQYLRFVILLRYKYLYLRFLRLPPCGNLWICPHFDQNILISQHLSFYPINWFLDKSANHIFTEFHYFSIVFVWVHWKVLSNWDCWWSWHDHWDMRKSQINAELKLRDSFAKSLIKSTSWELN